MLNCWLLEGFGATQRHKGRLLARKQPAAAEPYAAFEAPDVFGPLLQGEGPGSEAGGGDGAA
eukprot:3079151-Prymnesium_polylepis.1